MKAALIECLQLQVKEERNLLRNTLYWMYEKNIFIRERKKKKGFIYLLFF
jgi:hypothetical protein